VFGAQSLALNPAEVEVRQDEADEINMPRVQKEGGYVVDEPPADWRVEECTMRELLAEKFGTDIGGIATQASAGDLDRREILRVSSHKVFHVEYVPGVSLLNGRPSLNILSEPVPVAQLLIAPLDRYTARPTFVEQTFEHIFTIFLTSYLEIARLKQTIASTTKNTNRLRLTAEFDQSFEKVVIDGKPDGALTANYTLVGIQGFARDYLLTLSYVTQTTSDDSELAAQKAILQQLVDSFKLIKPGDVAREKEKFARLGDLRYESLIESQAYVFITRQANVLLKKWSEMNWNDPDSKEEQLKDIRRIRQAMDAFMPRDENYEWLGGQMDNFERWSPEELVQFVKGIAPPTQQPPTIGTA
jgi:hypothetical protein